MLINFTLATITLCYQYLFKKGIRYFSRSTLGKLMHFESRTVKMPKKETKSQVQGSKQGQKRGTESTQCMDPVTIGSNGDIVIKIQAKPGSKQNGITEISSDGISIQIAAPPVDGEANTELIKYLSKVLGVRKSDLTLDKGSKSRQKTVVVSLGSLTVDNVMSKFRFEKENG